MKFGHSYELQPPRPWSHGLVRRLFHEVLDRVEPAERLGIAEELRGPWR